MHTAIVKCTLRQSDEALFVVDDREGLVKNSFSVNYYKSYGLYYSGTSPLSARTTPPPRSFVTIWAQAARAQREKSMLACCSANVPDTSLVRMCAISAGQQVLAVWQAMKSSKADHRCAPAIGITGNLHFSTVLAKCVPSDWQSVAVSMIPLSMLRTLRWREMAVYSSLKLARTLYRIMWR